MDKSEKKESFGKKYGLILALIAMAIVYLFPTPVDLPTQGHRLIGILVFAVIIWMTEGVSYPVSAFVIVTFMAFALGMAPDPAKHGALLGTSKALQMGLSGFSTTAWALVAAAMFLSAGMMSRVLTSVSLLSLCPMSASSPAVLSSASFSLVSF